MACDYQGIRADNERRYGTDIGRIGPMLLANRYDDRTHFIFELLQNAEDALARRVEWQGSRSVTFYLKEGGLQVSHFGQPFDEADVRGICGIAETTKDLTAIGRFGIGFKSVYAFTERPEIHSGAEDFAIESFVWPVAVPPLSRDADSTAILIPLRPDDDDGCMEIASGLSRLGASSLLFLRQIEEIRWGVQGGSSGLYLRESTDIAPGIRRITVIGQEYGKAEVDEQWLVFSRPICADDGEVAGHIEIAWSIAVGGRERLRRVERSPLVVFFPTVLETHLGFLLQGPYRTTPSRDNVPSRDQWNQRCVRATAELLIEALCWLRHQGLLDAAALRCLPLDHAKFAEDSMFAPLFEATKDALTNERLLPCSSDGYASAKECRFARTRELRELLSSAQLSSLFAEVTPLHWLSGDISQDRTPELRLYLMRELDVGEVTPETVLPKLSAAFLEGQSDEWILRLYEFLNGQPALKQRAAALPLVRLSNGAHLRAIVNGQPHAFLPGPVETGFPTVRRTVCESEEARAFLRSLGLTEPDPVDDVIWNVLPKYRANEVDVPDAAYESDIARVMAAFATDSKGQREKLITALRETTFVMAVDAGDTHEYVERPGELYITTDRLKELFASVPGVMLTDNRYKSLRGEDVRGLLEACGAVRYLRPISDNSLSWQARARLREQAGHADTSGYNDRVTDWTLQGLEDLLKHLPKLDRAERTTRARLLWEELGDLEERRGKGIFTGEYSWTHYGSYRITFDAAFVRALNASAWVPGADGNLHRPSSVLLDSLDWKPNPFLLSKIPFKPPVIDQLAREAGIEPGVLELLKKLGVTSEAKLRERLGLSSPLLKRRRRAQW